MGGKEKRGARRKRKKGGMVPGRHTTLFVFASFSRRLLEGEERASLGKKGRGGEREKKVNPGPTTLC